MNAFTLMNDFWVEMDVIHFCLLFVDLIAVIYLSFHVFVGFFFSLQQIHSIIFTHIYLYFKNAIQLMICANCSTILTTLQLRPKKTIFVTIYKNATNCENASVDSVVKFIWDFVLFFYMLMCIAAWDFSGLWFHCCCILLHSMH